MDVMFFSRIFSILVVTFVQFRFMKLTYQPRRYHKIIFVTAYLLYVVSYSFIPPLIPVLNNLVLNSLFNFLLFTYVSYLLFQPLKRKFFLNMIFYLYLLFVDAITIPLFTFITGKDMADIMDSFILMISSGVVSLIILLCTFNMVTDLLCRRFFEYGVIRQSVFFLFLSVFEMFIIITLITLESNLSPIYTLLSLTSFLVIDIYIIIMLENISKSNALQHEIMLSQQHSVMTAKYYDTIQAKYDDSQKTLHDIKNHIAVIENLYCDQKYAEGREYTEKTLEQIDRLGYAFKCTNPVLNVVVNDKLLLAHSKNIDITLNIEDVDLSSIDYTDITCILANLLDNAIEASELVSDPSQRSISFNLHKVKNHIILKITNHFNNEIKMKSNAFTTTKSNHSGIGLSSVRSAVESYDGSMNITHENNLFNVSIAMPISVHAT